MVMEKEKKQLTEEEKKKYIESGWMRFFEAIPEAIVDVSKSAK